MPRIHSMCRGVPRPPPFCCKEARCWDGHLTHLSTCWNLSWWHHRLYILSKKGGDGHISILSERRWEWQPLSSIYLLEPIVMASPPLHSIGKATVAAWIPVYSWLLLAVVVVVAVAVVVVEVRGNLAKHRHPHQRVRIHWCG